MRPSLWFYPAPPVSYLMTSPAQTGPAMPAPGGRKPGPTSGSGPPRGRGSLGLTAKRRVWPHFEMGFEGAGRGRSCPPPWLPGTCSATLNHIIRSYLS